MINSAAYLQCDVAQSEQCTGINPVYTAPQDLVDFRLTAPSSNLEFDTPTLCFRALRMRNGHSNTGSVSNGAPSLSKYTAEVRTEG